MSIRQNNGRRGRPRNPAMDDGVDEIIGSPDAGSVEVDSVDAGASSSDDDEGIDPVSKMPNEISDLIQGLGISGDFRVALFKIPEGKRKSELQATYQSRCPDVEEFASEFGGGDYILVITWYQNIKDKLEKMQRKIQISVGKHFDLIARKKQTEKQREFQMENMFPVVKDQNTDNPLDILVKYSSLLPKQNNSMEMFAPILAIMQQSNQQMLQMMQANMQMLVTVMGNKRIPIEDVKEVMQLTEMLGSKSEKRSITEMLIEEGFGLLKELAPVAKEFIKGMNNPFTRSLAKKKLLSDPKIIEVLNDPEKKAQMIEWLYQNNDAGEVDTALIQIGVINETERRG